MIDSERMEVFLSTLRPENPEHLNALRDWCIERNYPIIRKETEDLLRLVISARKPEKILEIGTCAGYSTSFMMHIIESLDYLNNSSSSDKNITTEKDNRRSSRKSEPIITTIEIRSEHVEEARENFKKFGISDSINVIEGNAEKNFDSLVSAEPETKFDLVFIDAAKAQYQIYFDKAAGLLSSDGIIICDNVLQDESLLDSRYTIVQRDRTIHDRMRAFLYDITHRDDFMTQVLPIADGMSVSVRK